VDILKELKEKLKSFGIGALWGLLFWIVCMILLSPFVNAISCDYDKEPYLKGEINWLCSFDNPDETFRCYAYTMYKSDILHVYPVPVMVEDIGMIDYFEGTGSIAIEFGKEDLYEGYNYTFGVLCSSTSNNKIEKFNTSVVPVYSELRTVPYKANWIKNNIGYIIGIIIIWVIIGIIWRVAKPK